MNEVFEFIKDANLKLDELAKKDKKYKDITHPLKELLSNIKGEFLGFKKSHESILKNTHDSHDLLKSTFNQKILMLQKNLEHHKDEVKNKRLQLDSKQTNDLKEIEKETSIIIAKHKDSIKELELKQGELKREIQTAKAKEISEIERLIAEIKKHSDHQLKQIEENHQSLLIEIKKSYDENVLTTHESMNSKKAEVALRLEQMNLLKNTYRDQSDKKYLSIKNDYHLESIQFNQHVDLLKKEKDEFIKKAKDTYKKALIPIDDEKYEFNQKYELTKKEIEDSYHQKFLVHKKQMDEMNQEYSAKKEQIIKETAEAITLYNSKLTAFRETIQLDRHEYLTQYKVDFSLLSTEDDKKDLNRNKNKYLRSQDNELNKQIHRTNRATIQKNKEQYQKLYDLEIALLEKQMKWRIEGKLMIINQKLLNFKNDQEHLYHQKQIEFKQKSLKYAHDFELEKIELVYLSKIAPLELKLSVANSISERDINLLSNDTNYHLNYYQHQEDLIAFELESFILEQETLLESLKLYYDYQLNVTQMTHQLTIDKENVIRDLKIKTQLSKKDLSIYAFERQALSLELDTLESILEINSEIDFLMKKERVYSEQIESLTQIEIEKINLSRSLEEFKSNLNEHLEYITLDSEILYKDLDIVQSRIHFLFNQIYVIYNIHHHFMLQLMNLYQLPAHPEDIKLFIQLSLDIFKNLSFIQEQSKDEFLIDLHQYHETKINDLMNLRMNTKVDFLNNELNHKLDSLELSIENYVSVIEKYEYQIKLLNNNIDKKQSEINILDNRDDQGNKNYKLNKELLSKQMNDLESEVSNIETEILKNQKAIDKIEQTKQKLYTQFEQSKKNLSKKYQIEANVYLNQMSIYQRILSKLTQLFKTYEQKVDFITQKLNQPIYLTDNIMKEYQKGYDKIETYFELKSNVLYQELLKVSVRLINQLISDQESLKTNYYKDFEQKELEIQKKMIQSEQTINQVKKKYQEIIIDASNEKSISFKALKDALHKDRFHTIQQLKDSMVQTESYIMNNERNLENESKLIDANLSSVIAQFKVDYDKAYQKVQDLLNKNMSKLVEAKTIKDKNLKQLEDSTQSKNGLLHTKFNQNEVKLTEFYQNKITEYKENLNKKQAHFEKRIQQIHMDLEQTTKQKTILMDENQKEYEQFGLKVEMHEKKLYQKELLDAKKSFAFKSRTLKL